MSAALIFDLDGTLVDSLADIAAAANLMLQDIGLPPLPQDTIGQFVGNGLPKLVERTMRHCGVPPERHQELTRLTLSHYSAGASKLTKTYPGVVPALEALQAMGCAMGICTNKPESPARHILGALDLSRFFDVVLGGDTLDTRKPDPKHLTVSFDRLGTALPQIFVGDSEVDAETAQRAAVPFLLYTKGYRKSPVTDIPHTDRFDTWSDLPLLVRDHLTTAAR